MPMVRALFLTMLWVFTGLLVLFTFISSAGLVIRTPVLIALAITIVATITRNTPRASMWIITAAFGFIMIMGSLGILIHSFATGNSHASSQIQSMKQNTRHYVL